MSVLVANCPSCGGPVEFKSGQSIVVICEYCHSAVARTDRELKDLGKVAELVETGSPLDIGIRGKWKDINFELTGRAQLGHEMGGQWDEWYATFSNGWLGWLAEAQGGFYLTFQYPLPEGAQVPQFDQLQLGQSVPGLPWPTPLIVAETGRATARGAKGEIPYLLTPGETYYYADLSGVNGAFGTLDYNESPPLVFLGQQVTLAELGITTTRTPEREERRVGAAQVSCPNCAGPLELRAPDKTERVTCPNCNSLLDVNQGQLQFLKALEKPWFQPLIPLGTTGETPEGKMMLIGAMARSVTLDGVTYFWSEYLLYNPQIGFRWLVHSDDHWNYVQAVPPGEVMESEKSVSFRGKNYRIFQDAQAKVEVVLGEFYWKVETGEQVRGVDYVAPPYMLSKEVSTVYVTDPKNPEKTRRATGEINWSLGTYVPVQQIEKAFNVTGLPRPSGVAPNQPYKHKWIYKYWLLFIGLLLLIGLLLFAVSGSEKEVFKQTMTLDPLQNADATSVFFSQPFELAGRRNIRIVGESPVQNTWVYLEGDLINDETGVVQSFPIDISYYSGVEDGESWSEGDRTDSAFTSAMPAGRYVLRLEGQWEKWQEPAVVSVTVQQNVSHGFNLLLALIVMSIGPIVMGIYHIGFERRRWSESMFSSSGSDDDDDDDDE
jgi:Zn finger protein HypA/HybF involved in hydrogenase expression